jgi:hypothetical protein
MGIKFEGQACSVLSTATLAGTTHTGQAGGAGNSMETQRAVHLAISVITLAVLSACETFVTYPGAERPAADVAGVEGYYRNYVLHVAEGKITAVDGVRPSNLLQEAFSARLLPGRHWLEITEERYFGGSHGMTVCAIESDFKAGHRYQLQTSGNSSEVPWIRLVPGKPYAGSVVFKVSAPGVADEMQSVGTLCLDGGGSFCRRGSDCAPHPDMRCIPQQGTSFGMCGFELR